MTASNPFHAGELAAQDKAGTRGAASELAVGQRSTLNFSSNHDAFLAAQSFAVVSSVDQEDDNLWVTPLFGKAGDITAASETEILISSACIPKGDVLNNAKPGTPLSMLGIDLMKRTRHRINGIAGENSGGSLIHFEVKEYSPNCPKYINRRELIPAASNPINESAVRQERTTLTESDRDFIKSMDTLWIGSYAPNVGADANHRGGKPGFIRVTSDSIVHFFIRIQRKRNVLYLW
mmetsp:Transcript_26335/g.40404  ORF Transcript_26335/g.40404 Transcript_26335/m.40404 type:complete len:235 (+) Transcript_26335:566-1270(+)